MSDAIPAGWYPDPAGSGGSRWWDGTQWTEHAQTPYAAAAPLTAPADTPTNTVWIWLVIVLPILPVLPLLFIDWGSMSAYDLNDPASAYTSSFAMFLSPAYVLATIGGWLVYGLSVFFAYRDHKQLTAVGIPRPFHWAFAFLSSVVYAIGRSVVVKRRTGHGSAPMWAAIGSIVVIIVVTIVMTVQMFAAIMAQVSEYAPR